MLAVHAMIATLMLPTGVNVELGSAFVLQKLGEVPHLSAVFIFTAFLLNSERIMGYPIENRLRILISMDF